MMQYCCWARLVCSPGVLIEGMFHRNAVHSSHKQLQSFAFFKAREECKTPDWLCEGLIRRSLYCWDDVGNDDAAIQNSLLSASMLHMQELILRFQGNL